jgi:hypothetical protein
MNKVTETTARPTDAPCPGWCITHQGKRGTSNLPMSGDTPIDDVRVVGHHTTSTYFDESLFGFRTAVEVHQTITTAGSVDPQIILWPGIFGLENEPGMPPQTYRSLTMNHARELAAGLLAAADLLGTITPNRCEKCADAIPDTRTLCISCGITTRDAARKTAKARLTLVSGENS